MKKEARFKKAVVAVDITNIIVASIAFTGTLLGSYFANNKTVAVLHERIDNLKDQISSLDERVREHNNFDSRLSAMEAIIKRMEGER